VATDTLFKFHVADILNDTNYSLTQFEDGEIEAFNESIVVRKKRQASSLCEMHH
jgi:hypothetical protein